MKNFPRIFSVSTIGLIHHREFDYHFNAFRTDFIGESGSGKSMIADLIQLILVGYDAFESSTKGNEVRDPAGMVLVFDLNSKGIGYAFLNIEIGPQQFLVIGVYIETGMVATQAFVVQAGYDWNNVEYLSTSLSFRHFLKGEEILNTELLKEHLDNQGLHIKFWQKPKEYHRLLYKEKLVPLDLASSERILFDYAGILQSFSRGKSLDTQKSDGLKQFLFGNLESKRIMESFRKAQKDMEHAIGEYGNNLKEIERVTQKQREVLRLRDLKRLLDETRTNFLHSSLLFYNQEGKKFDRGIRENVTNYLKAYQYLQILQQLLQEDINQANNLLPALRSRKEEADFEVEDITPQQAQIRQIEDLLRQLNCKFEELQTRHSGYKDDQAQYAALMSLRKSLREKNVEDTFERISEKPSIGSIKEYLFETIKEQQHMLSQKKRLQEFSNINDPKSLAHWALQQKRRFSRMEESAIVAFQSLPRDKPNDNSDYLPKPSELILALALVEEEDEGFWITINGIHKFITYVQQQILNTDDENIIRSYFENYTHTLKQDITDLERQLKEFQFINEILDIQRNPTLSLLAYQRRESVLNFKEIPALNISPERLEEYEHIYIRRDLILEQFQHAKNQQRLVDEELRSLLNKQSDCSNALNYISFTIPSPELQSIIDQESVHSPFVNTYIKETENVTAILTKQANKTAFVRGESQSIQSALRNIYQLPDLRKSLDDCLQKLESYKIRYLKFYSQLPDSLETDDYVSNPADKEGPAYFQAETQYNATYLNIVEQYVPSESYQLSIDKDFVQMAKTLLPEAFYDKVVEEEANIVETIASYLTRINEKNRQLNNRKIQKIKDLLNEVDEIITQQENSVRRIDNFLKRGAQITGGYKARLHRKAAILFPKTWMTQFRDLLESEEHSGILQNKLGEKVDLEEMMITAFYSCGGSQAAKASVQKLLDPTNYYELFFSMESESGRVNKGSTGQTYAAISLLCIARLSILSADENKTIEPAVRIMPIDEAEGLGSNYDMLYDIAEKYDYQLLSLSIGPVGKFKDGEQYLYIIHKNMEVDYPVNYTPIAILSETDKNNYGVIYEQP